jgi:hypothetical protein
VGGGCNIFPIQHNFYFGTFSEAIYGRGNSVGTTPSTWYPCPEHVYQIIIGFTIQDGL